MFNLCTEFTVSNICLLCCLVLSLILNIFVTSESMQIVMMIEKNPKKTKRICRKIPFHKNDYF